MHKFPKFILEMKLYMFQTVLLSIISSYSLYTQQWCMSYRFVDSFRAAAAGWNCSSIRRHSTDNISKDTYIGTRHVILAKHRLWLPDDGFM
jgi:hypothetical protein